MASLPDLILTEHLPLAELHAAKLDGVLLPLADGFVAIDRPEGRPERLAAVAPRVPERMIVCEESAAWVWGALIEAPEPLRLCAHPRRRSRPQLDGTVAARELRLDPGDVVELAAASGATVTVTTPLRTSADLARATRPAAAAALRAMLLPGSVDPDEVVALLMARARLPGRRAALGAIEAARRAQPLLTR